MPGYNTTTELIPDEVVMSKIYLIREQKVMLDEDLAELYGVETKRLNEQVSRNIDRFPEDFMFKLTEEEFENLKSHFATSSWGGRRKLPNAFTEHGVLMLSSVLNSKQAIKVNIRIMRVYTRIREILLSHKDVFVRVEQFEQKLNEHDQKIELLFTYLARFNEKTDEERPLIGFKLANQERELLGTNDLQTNSKPNGNGFFGSTKGNVKPGNRTPSGGPPPEPATPPSAK